MTTAVIVLSCTTVALALALIGQSVAFAAERRSLMEVFRAKARDDVRAQLATSAFDYARAQGVEDVVAERAREAGSRREDDPPIEGFG